MNRDRWIKIETILDKALSLESSEKQEEFIRDACQDDKHLFRYVSDLLQSISDAQESNFLE